MRTMWAALLLLLTLVGCGTETGTEAPAQPRAVTAWGDSLTAGNEDGTGITYPGVLSQIIHVDVANEGIGGDTSTQIADRMLQHPELFNSYVLIWAGSNNSSQPATVEADIARMVGALPDHKHFLILSLENGAGANKSVGVSIYDNVIAINNDLAAIYPNNYLEVRELIVQNGLNFEGLIPTAQDLADIGNDCPPTSLRFDFVHLNRLGYDFVARTVADWIKSHP